MSEQPPKANQPDTPNDQPVDVAALLEKFNDAHQQQPDDVADKIEAAEEAIANNPAPDEATSISDQTEAAWAQHEESKADSGEENLETEVPLKEQWAQYLFQQRKLRQLRRMVDGKKQKILAEGGSEEDFTRQLWPHHRDALEELGVITAEDKDTFTPMFTKGVVEGARQLDRDFNERKKMVASALADNPELLQQVDQAIEADKEGYRKVHKGSAKDWDKRIAAKSEMRPLLTQQAGQSDYDAHLAPSDFTHMLQLAHEIADKQQPQPTERDKTGSKSEVPVELKQSTNEGEKQDDALLKEQITKAAEVFVAKPTLYGPIYRQKLGEARYRYKKALVNTIDDSNMSPDEVNKLLAQKWRDEGVRVATAGVLQEMGLLEGVNLESLSDKKLRQISNDFWHARARNLKQKSQGTKPEDGAGDLPKVDLSGLEPPEKLTLAQQEERWMGLVQQYGASNGDRSLRQQVSEAYDKLQEMRSSPETLAELRQELSELSQQYDKQFDKSSPEARELARAATAKYNEIQALEQWQATNAESARAGKLPRIELPDDPLDPDGAGRLPRVTLPDDPLNVRHNQQPNDLRQQVLEAAAAYEQAEEGEAKEQARARYEALQEQLRAAENPPANEPLTKQAELDNLRKAYLDEKDPTKRIEKKKLYGEAYNEWKARQEHVAEETIKIRAEVANETEAGKDVTYGERLRAAMDRYTKLKADSETKGIDIKLGRITLWRGRAKREKLLKEAEAELMAAKIAYEKVVMDKVHDANLYEGTDEQIEAQCRNDFFTAVRRLDIETRQAVNDELEDRKENRNIFERAATAIFGWMGKGGKLRTAGTVGAGAAAGVGIVMSGAAWPITAAVVGGAKFAIYHGVKTKRLDDMRAETVDANGNAKGVMTDAAFEGVKSTAVKSGASVEATAQGIATEIFDLSRQEGYERVNRATEAAKRAIGKFGIGVAIGAGGVGAYRAISGLAEASATQGNGGGDKPPAEGGDKPPAGGGEIKGKSFYVEGGSGLIRELRQFATANGLELTATEAADLHRDLIKEFGKDYIDIRGVNSDIYTRSGDVRLSAPGKATWEEGVPEFIQKWMERKGLWK